MCRKVCHGRPKGIGDQSTHEQGHSGFCSRERGHRVANRPRTRLLFLRAEVVTGQNSVSKWLAKL